ncbi:MAG: glycerol-3-phosphate dehydrogenase [Alphaproteobacteria bacterium]
MDNHTNTASFDSKPAKLYDVFIVGGGVNGCGIARDAAGRGLNTCLVEMNDLAGATSSASTKLFHGGLRYLEHYKFRLVRESLLERETLLRAMPHISWPLRFILPHHQGLRPAWLLRLGLFIYDHLGGRKLLPPTKRINFKQDQAGNSLKSSYRFGFEYSDCWVDDSRLVVLNACDAKARGADILTRTTLISATKAQDHWVLTCKDAAGNEFTLHSKLLINAAGPWVNKLGVNRLGVNKLIVEQENASDRQNKSAIRLVRGSHIVVNKLYDHDKCFILQGADGRIVFLIPYERDFTLIGTTDAEHDDAPENPQCSDQEAEYLCNFVNEYLDKPVSMQDIIWRYSGVRALYDDDGVNSASAVSRDYKLSLDEQSNPPLLTIFGGKITTYRKLAEAAMAKIAPYFPAMGADWTAGVPLPGGAFPVDGVDDLLAGLKKAYPFMTDAHADRFIKSYGSDSALMLGNIKSIQDMGAHFGHDLYEIEVKWLLNNEFALNAQDILWRRSKLGLYLTKAQADDLDKWIKTQ